MLTDLYSIPKHGTNYAADEKLAHVREGFEAEHKAGVVASIRAFASTERRTSPPTMNAEAASRFRDEPAIWVHSTFR